MFQKSVLLVVKTKQNTAFTQFTEGGKGHFVGQTVLFLAYARLFA